MGAQMSWPSNGGGEGRHVFLIEMDAGPDALMRALGPFALHEAKVVGLGLDHGDERMRLRVEAAGVCADLARRLGLKLEALPSVRAVGVGWTCA